MEQPRLHLEESKLHRVVPFIADSAPTEANTFFTFFQKFKFIFFKLFCTAQYDFCMANHKNNLCMISGKDKPYGSQGLLSRQQEG